MRITARRGVPRLGSLTVPIEQPRARTPSPTDVIADRYVEDYCALEPIAATFFGVPGHETQLTDYGADGFAARADLARRAVGDLRRIEPADDRERVARAAMVERLSTELDLFDAGDLSSELNTTASPMQSLRIVFDLMATESEEDWATVADRMAKLPAAFETYAGGLAAAAAAGRVAAQRQVRTCAEIATRWAGDDEAAPFFTGLVERSETDGALRRDLEAAASAANEALLSFSGFLRDRLLPAAPLSDAVGEQRYARWLRYFTGADLDLAETYDWGWSELARIVADKESVAEQIAPGQGLASAIAALDEDAARILNGRDELTSWLQSTADAAVSALAGTHFDIPDPVRTIEGKISPTSGEGIYYTGPSEDFSRPGRMWWSLPAEEQEFTTWREKTTVYHEGVPGHHLQIAQTVYRAELLNRYQRLMLWCSGHGEGWALYAERLMAELGFLDDPGDRLGMLDAQGFRAARVVLDIGMHLELPIPAGTGFHEGEIWNPDIGLEFLRVHASMDDQTRQDELNRYLGWPGQAPSYKVGERVWLEARAEAEARLGSAFDLKAFHTAALNLGGLGLDLLKAELASSC
ncbi:MAG: DUF885 domain-containing protein [Geodermatophilaceae bacterium]|nr:DUF885 domain-containing protein [Geodermatophilaceae bacterium]